MKFKLTTNEFKFLISLNGINEFIVHQKTDDNITCFEVSDISGFQDEIYFNIVENGMDRDGDVNSTGNQIYYIYDKLLFQKNTA